MTSRRLSPVLASLSVVAATAAIGLAAPASAATATTLYANPQGSSLLGSACNKIDPCAIGIAFSNAVAGDSILVEPGTYQQGSTSLALTANDVHVSGVPGAAAPVIVSSATTGIEITPGSTLTGATVTYSGSRDGLVVDATGAASHVAVAATAASACAVFGTLTDSLCVTTAASSAAVGGTQSGAETSPVLRGVTAVATQPTSFGVQYQAPANETLAVTATNVIAKGGAASVEALAGSQSSASVSLTHSDFSHVIATSTSTGEASVIYGAGNISASPKFVDATKGDYEEAEGSATINAGAADPKTDLTDLAGRPRVIDGKVDIGAYEYAFAPTLKSITAKPAAKTVKLSVLTNPNGLATKVHFVVRGGKKPIVTKKFATGAGAARETIATTVKGLTPKTKYTVYATAKNNAGHQTTKTIKFTTT